MLKNELLSLRKAPGRPEKPLLLEASVLGLCHSDVPIAFILPPATLSPPKNVVNVAHSASVGTCQPCGANCFLNVGLSNEAAS